MSRKRMILEEVEEKNLLVPGSPDNPMPLGERMKGMLVRLALREKQGLEPAEALYSYSRNYDTDMKMLKSYEEAAERLQYLGLVEEFSWSRPARVVNPQHTARILELYAAIKAIGEDPHTEAIKETGSDRSGYTTYDYSTLNTKDLSAMHDEIKKLRGIEHLPERRWRITDKGRDLLLKGTVTVTL